MKIVFDAKKLRDALKIVGRAVPAKTTLPILYAIEITATKNGTVWLSANNMTVYIETSLSAEVDKDFVMCIPFKKIEQFATSMSDPIVLDYNPDTLRANLTCGNYKAKNVECFDHTDFPSLNETEWETSFEMPADEFVKRAERALISATHKDDAAGKYSLAFYVKDGKLAMICRDAFRMSYVNNVDVNGADGDYLVPEVTMDKVVGITREYDSIIVHLAKNRVGFEWVNTNLYSSTLAFNMSYAHLDKMRDPLLQYATVKRTELERALAVNKIFSEELPKGMEDYVKIVVGKDGVRVYSDDDAFGDATVSAEVEGDGVEFVTSRSQIQDFLKVAGTENVVMGVGTRIGAVYLKPQGDDSFVNTLALVSVQENNGGK